MTTSIIPYLNFNGKCRDAMSFYQKCLGGELSMQKISDSPMAAEMPSEAGAQIMHSSLTNGNMVLMGSDMMGSALEPGNKIGLCLNCGSDEEINFFFNNLSEGARAKTPLHQTFWGGTYGEITDRFGMNWMFNYVKG